MLVCDSTAQIYQFCSQVYIAVVTTCSLQCYAITVRLCMEFIPWFIQQTARSVLLVRWDIWRLCEIYLTSRWKWCLLV